VEELEEKRCVAFLHCARQAKAYYGTIEGTKALCASWAESFCFGNELTEASVREHHVRARETVNRNPALRGDCRAIALELSKCMSNKYY
jgi:hypothetical protein